MSDSNELKWQLIQHAATVQRTRQAVEYLRQFSLEPIVIKGLVAADFYDKPFQRQSSDVDLVISEEDFEIYGNQFDKKELAQKQIDLHIGLRRLDLLPFADFREHSRKTIIEGIKLTVPSPEDHLRILCAHWLLDGGIFFNKLWDVFYLVKNRTTDFDWQLCLGNEITASWVKFTIAVTIKYLKLDSSGIPFKDEMLSNTILTDSLVTILEKKWKNQERRIELNSIRNQKILFWRQVLLRLKPDPFKAAVNTSSKLSGKISYKLILKDLLQRYDLFRMQRSK